jgi:DNA-binding LacI/PurR family transcriptional regulator
LGSLNHPIITVDFETPGLRSDSVVFDTFGAGCILADHLIGLGHRNLAYIGGYRGSQTTQISPEPDSFKMQAGVEYSASAHGVNLLPDRVKHLSISRYDDACSLACSYLSQPNPPSGFIFFDPSHAVAFRDYARAKGLVVPRDVSICCFGCDASDPVAERDITTTPTNSETIGKAAGELLIQRIESPQMPPVRVNLPLFLEERGTTAAKQ